MTWDDAVGEGVGLAGDGLGEGDAIGLEPLGEGLGVGLLPQANRSRLMQPARVKMDPGLIIPDFMTNPLSVVKTECISIHDLCPS